MLDSVIGQTRLKREIEIAIRAAQFRQEPLGHILLTGIGGLGKTHLLNAICKELKAHLTLTQGKRLSSSNQVKEFFLNGKEKSGNKSSFFVIDEIHEMSMTAQEELYYPLDNGTIVTLDEPINLGNFTLAGATTDPHELNSKSLINRFDHVWELEVLNIQELMIIIANYFKKELISFSQMAIETIANRSKGLPRLALGYAARVRDRVQCYGRKVVFKDDVLETFISLNINEIGLDKNQQKYLTILSGSDKPLGIESIAGRLDLPLDQVKLMIEPYLRQIGLIISSTQGRELTDSGIEYVKDVIVSS